MIAQRHPGECPEWRRVDADVGVLLEQAAVRLAKVIACEKLGWQELSAGRCGCLARSWTTASSASDNRGASSNAPASARNPRGEPLALVAGKVLEKH